MNIISVLKFITLLGAFTFTRLLYAVDTFDYSNYPASALNNNNSTCLSSNIVLTKLYMKTPSSSQYTLVPHTIVHLSSAIFAPGNFIKAVYQTNSAACSNQPISLALYSTEEGSPDKANLEAERQLLVASSTERLYFGGSVAVQMQIPPGFCGPYQFDSVLGRPLPMIGKNRSFYTAIYRTSQNLPMSDNRDMLVNIDYRGVMTGGVCKTAATGSFPSLAATEFDYAKYPGNQAIGSCTNANIATYFPSGGFSVNGVPTSNLSNLKPNDKVTFTYRATSEKCNGKNITMAFYRNPNGANGYDGLLTQALIVNDVQSMYGNGSTRTLNFTVPSYFTGGWQIDVALGNPIPILGNIGTRYGTMLFTAEKGFM